MGKCPLRSTRDTYGGGPLTCRDRPPDGYSSGITITGRGLVHGLSMIYRRMSHVAVMEKALTTCSPPMVTVS